MRRVTYAIRDVIVAAQELEKQGKTVLKLNIGDPNAYDFDTPAYVKKALVEALDKKLGGYADSQGFPRLREAVAANNTAQGFASSAEEVVVTSGLSEGVNMLYGSLLEPGDEILLPSPCYPQYEMLAYYYGAIPKFYELREENGFAPDFDSMKRQVTKRTKALVLINPDNPTGTVFDEHQLRQFIDFAGEHGLAILSDQIYSEMVFDSPHVATASLTKDVPVVEMNGLSKNFLAPGWRVGWLSFCNFRDDSLRKSVVQLCRLRLSASYPAQYASAVALEDEKQYAVAKKAMLGKLKPRRDLAARRLNEIPGISCVKPQGAFYAFPQVHDERKVWPSDKEFVYELLAEKGVLTVFGSGFAEKPGSKHFRIVFLPPEQTLEKAFDGIEAFMKAKGF